MAAQAPPRLTLSNAAEGILLATLAIAPWPFGSALDWARNLVVAAILSAGALWAASLARRGEGLPRLAGSAAPILFVLTLQVAFVHPLSRELLAEAGLVLLAAVTAALFWSERTRDHTAARRLAAVVIAVCLAEGIFGAVQWSQSPGLIYGRSTPVTTSPFGSYVNHNHFAGLLEMGTLLALGLTVGLGRRHGAGPLTVAMGGTGLGLAVAQMASRSRGGFVSLLVGLATLAWLSAGLSRARLRPLRKLLLGMSFAGMALVSVLLLPHEAVEHLGTILAGTSEGSAAYRVDIARDTVRLALRHPLLGVGLGNYPDAFPAVKRGHGEVRTSHAEDDVLEYAAETGLLGLGAAGCLLLGFGSALRDRLLTGRDPLRLGIAAGAAAACTALLAHSFLDFNLRIPANALTFASLAGLAASYRSERPAFGRASSACAAVVLAAGAVGSLILSAGYQRLDAARAAADPSLRIVAYDGAARRCPILPEVFRERGLCWAALARPPDGLGVERLSRAMGDLSRAVRLRPAWAEAWSDRGWVAFRLGDVQGAEEFLDRAVSLDPTNLQVGVARADFRARVRGPREGIDDLRRLRGENPGWDLGWITNIAATWTQDPSLLSQIREPAR